MTTVREQVLSEFMDAWNAGRRPEVDDYLARVPADERDAFTQELLAFLTFVPTPEYSDEALAAISAESAGAAATERAGLLAALLARLRERSGLHTEEVASRLVGELGLAETQRPKTTGYLRRLEAGRLEPSRVSQRVFVALGRIFGISGDELEGAADARGWMPLAAAPAAVFRADKDAARDVSEHLDVLADALETPGAAARDEVDELFLGGR